MSAVKVSNPGRGWEQSFAQSSRGLRRASAGFVCGRYLAAGMVLGTKLVSGQEALLNSPAGAATAEAHQLEPESKPYTFKSGDFRLLVTPSLEVDWNDNVTLSKTNVLEDFIIRPLVDFSGSYPINQRNLLEFSVGIGYDKYLEDNQFSALRLVSGSGLSFDAYIKDFRINVHDRFQYIQDPAEEASVAATGRYGGLDNIAGLFTTWDLKDLALTLGFDHENFVASSSQFNYLNRATELLTARAGFRLHPTFTAGVEATPSLTTYAQPVLNNDRSYSGGIFADWKPGSYFQLHARVGYITYLLDQTSTTITAVNQHTVYGDLTVSHEITKSLSYSLSGGHELRLGTSADLIEDSYARLSVDLNIIKNLAFNMFLSYEHGQQGQANATGALAETFDWLGTGLNLSHPITKNLTATLTYRLTLRSSDVAYREYTQNLVGLRLAYAFK